MVVFTGPYCHIYGPPFEDVTLAGVPGVRLGILQTIGSVTARLHACRLPALVSALMGDGELEGSI
jgi:hypothetical protein